MAGCVGTGRPRQRRAYGVWRPSVLHSGDPPEARFTAGGGQFTAGGGQFTGTQARFAAWRGEAGHKLVGLDTDTVQLAIKTLSETILSLSREFNSPTDSFRTTYVRVEPPSRPPLDPL
eukprot:476041-Pyramimonas_sp.AAC.1